MGLRRKIKDGKKDARKSSRDKSYENHIIETMYIVKILTLLYTVPNFLEEKSDDVIGKTILQLDLSVKKLYGSSIFSFRKIKQLLYL